MEFAFTEEQVMIRDTAASFLADVSNSEAIREAMATEQGYSTALWQRICSELYFQAVTIPEEFGGMGLGYVELVAVMEQMGRYVVCAPYFSTVCLASSALLVAANEAQQATYFGKILDGGTATLAFTGNGQWHADGVTAEYRRDGEQFIVDGDYRYVIDGHTSDSLVIAAREQGGDKLALFVLPADTAGVERTWRPTLDQTRKQADIRCNGVVLSAENLMSDDAAEPLAKIVDLATVCLAAEQMGGSQQVLDMTVEYTKERVQFNRPVASFQAVKHQAADMMSRAEASRSGVYYAACIAQEALIDGPLGGELREAASIAKSFVSEAYFKNAGDALQLHGGVGFTWEYDVHLYFKRAKASEHYLGNAAYHRERLATLLLD
ncbi:alkylation response protein AidB-like acyl-CoA dehydrogenase [Sinobacterium caligoides]|uniref:Alkylation response protein AidB-like acyl-CoA dehydrogenase n=1 Tax=Sinobacterium caligoides TaxID=933926 RepID=A0A3N2E0I0_9GAMM|nr:acyl-CoA dehydrogenase family protein [Sinobacterium caligoides]ROS05610.1 alkylation response protein AidB-like acyl-CoA dehydrogenase [Sinobacterium caligoides]